MCAVLHVVANFLSGRGHPTRYSSSWGPDDDGKSFDGPGPLAKKAIEQGIYNGRGGLGSIYVVAAGNGAASGDQCNADGYANSPCVINVQSSGSIKFSSDSSVLCLVVVLSQY